MSSSVSAPIRASRLTMARGSDAMLFATIIFAGALVVIASERVDRTKVALVGAVLVVLSQAIDQERAIAGIDWETIGLLAGMMLIVRVTEPTGIHTFLAGIVTREDFFRGIARRLLTT